MNMHLNAAMMEAAQIDALLEAIDKLYLDQAPDQLQYIHMTAWDIVKKLREELELLAEDKRVVDAIYALQDTHRAST